MSAVSKPYEMRDRVIVQPTIEPVTLAELKAHLRITGATEDAFLTPLIVASRTIVEEWLKRKLIEQTLEGFLDQPGIITGQTGRLTSSFTPADGLQEIQLPWLPTISVTSITLFSSDDTASVMAATSYRVDVVDRDLPSRIALKESVVWPGSSFRNQNSLRVEWKAGYGPTAADVPEPIKLAIKMLAAQLYANRGECSDGDSCLGTCGAKPIISVYRVLSV